MRRQDGGFRDRKVSQGGGRRERITEILLSKGQEEMSELVSQLYWLYKVTGRKQNPC